MNRWNRVIRNVFGPYLEKKAEGEEESCDKSIAKVRSHLSCRGQAFTTRIMHYSHAFIDIACTSIVLVLLELLRSDIPQCMEFEWKIGQEEE